MSTDTRMVSRSAPGHCVALVDSPGLERCARLARRALGATGAWVVLREGSGVAVCAHAGTEPAVGASAGSEAPRLINDLRSRPPARPPAVDAPGCIGYAEAPIRDGAGQVVGWLAVADSRPRQWTEADAELLEEAAAAAATELALYRERHMLSRTEAALHRSEAKFRSLFDNTGIGVVLIGSDGWLIRSNPALQEMLGLGEDELRGRTVTDFIHPDDRPKALGAFDRMADGREAHHEEEYRLLPADGRQLWVHATASLVRDAEGRPVCALALVADVTQRRKAEEALTESQRQLLLAQRMEAVGRLAGGIAHDFNNLLTVIGSFAQLIEVEMELGDEARLYVTEIQKASSRAASLTRQLLAFSRQQVLRPQRLDLNHVMWEMEGMLRRLIGEDLELATDLDPSLLPVRADPGQVEQVIMNLVVNARDAMPQGGRVALRTRNAELTPENARAYPYPVEPGRYARLTVSDTGHGMDRETLGRVFEPFFTTKGPGQGTGLGLSTAYGIVKQSGGYIWASSQPGQGTTFDIYLPVLNEAPEGGAERGGASPVRGGAETVLLVEDEDTIRSLAERILRRKGYTVLAAARGDEALRLFDEHQGRIDLLLTDVVMPGMNGRALAQRLLARAPGLPVLFMSGYTADAIQQYGVLNPGTEFLDKPFTPDVLAAAVRRVLDGVG